MKFSLELPIRVQQDKVCILGAVRVIKDSKFVRGSVIYAVDKEMNRIQPAAIYGRRTRRDLYAILDIFYLVKQEQIIRQGEFKGKASLYIPTGLSEDNKQLIFRDISILYWGEKYVDLYAKNLDFVVSQLQSAGMSFPDPEVIAEIVN